MPGRYVHVLALVATLVLTTACGSDETGDAGRPVATPTPSRMDDLQLPIKAYLVDYAHQARSEALQYKLRDGCIKAKGFTPPPMGTGEELVSRRVRLWRYYDTRRYALSDLTAARENGFKLPSFARGTAKPIIISTLPESLRKALTDCTRAADQRLNQAGVSGLDAGDESNLAKEIETKNFLASQSDPRVVDVFNKWSSCMKSKGYNYAKPEDSSKDPRWAAKGDGPEALAAASATPEETKAAVAEVECAYATNVLGVSFAVEAEYENKAIEKNTEALNDLKTRNERAVKKIDELWVQSG